MSYRIAHSLEVLRDEVNALWPARDKASDGFIGDAAHAASASDHNPNPAGVVCAFDITHDANGPTGTDLAERLRARRHPDVKYVIWSGRMFSAYAARGVAPFEWRPYLGADPHTNHVHVSVGVGPDGQSQPPYDDPDPWLEEDDDNMNDQQVRDLFAAVGRIDNALNDPNNGALARLVALEHAIDGDAEADAQATSGLSVQLKEIRRNVRRVGRATGAAGIEGAMPNP